MSVTTVASSLAAALVRVQNAQNAQNADEDVPVTIGGEAAREAARRELSDPKYHQNDPGLLQRALEWVWDTIGRLLSSAAGVTPGGWVGLLAVGLLVLVLVVALRLRMGSVRAALPSGGRGVFGDRPRTAAEHRTAAERHAAAGDWSRAVQERMRALVRALEERALLDPRPGRTADEAAAEAGRVLPGHAAELRSAALVFDEVTYAGRPADAQAYSALRTLDTAVGKARPDLAGSTSSGGGR
ncbi:DUF4129 domain-containing protein [Streptomyces sp. 549]|nr:DUF4129 domain-containing protein [Streptomyces sp. 549]